MGSIWNSVNRCSTETEYTEELPEQRMSPEASKQKEPGAGLSKSMIRLQVQRILARETFSRSERLSGFLKFIVGQTLEGRAADLKEQIIGAEFYGKGADFAGAADSVVNFQ